MKYLHFKRRNAGKSLYHYDWGFYCSDYTQGTVEKKQQITTGEHLR